MNLANLARVLLKRLVFPSVFLVITELGVLSLVHLTPARPSNPEIIAALRAEYHFGDPLVVQYGKGLLQVLQADLGHSISGNRSVSAC
jgi:ABC-type dipeptide/oligopeptide/nickel transport system permease component